MGILSGVLGEAQKIFADGKKQVLQFRDKALAEGFVASCMYLAIADGELQTEEAMGMTTTLMGHPTLSIFADKLQDMMKPYIAVIANPSMVRMACMTHIAKLSGKPEAIMIAASARQIVATKSNGKLSNDEQTAFNQLCQMMNIRPQDVPSI